MSVNPGPHTSWPPSNWAVEWQFARNGWKWLKKILISSDRSSHTPFRTNTQAAKRHMEDHNLTKKEKSPVSAIVWNTLTVLLNHCEMLYRHYVSAKMMVNWENYCYLLQKLREHITKKDSTLKGMHHYILHDRWFRFNDTSAPLIFCYSISTLRNSI